MLNKPVLIPQSDVTSLGSAIFAALAAGAFRTIEEAQATLCPKYRVVEPDHRATEVYEELYGIFREMYFGFGRSEAAPIAAGHVLSSLRRIARGARGAT